MTSKDIKYFQKINKHLSNKINYVHFPLSAFTVTGLFHTIMCIVLIRTWRMNLSSWLSAPLLPLLPHLHIPITSHMLTFITAMMDYWHPANMTGCHRSLSRDFQTVSTRINYYWNSLLRLKYWSFSANLGLREGRRGRGISERH